MRVDRLHEERENQRMSMRNLGLEFLRREREMLHVYVRSARAVLQITQLTF